MLYVTLIVPMPPANAFNQIAALGNVAKVNAQTAPGANPSQQVVAVSFLMGEADLPTLQSLYKGKEGASIHIIQEVSQRGDEGDEIIARSGFTKT